MWNFAESIKERAFVPSMLSSAQPIAPSVWLITTDKKLLFVAYFLSQLLRVEMLLYGSQKNQPSLRCS